MGALTHLDRSLKVLNGLDRGRHDVGKIVWFFLKTYGISMIKMYGGEWIESSVVMLDTCIHAISTADEGTEVAGLEVMT